MIRLETACVPEYHLYKAQEVNVPSKFVVNYVNVPLHCQAFYVDMEGLNDGRAIKTIVPQVNPRKMVRFGLPIQRLIQH